LRKEIMTQILFISRYYPPEKGAEAVCVSETAKRLVRLGNEVTVLTTVPNYPTGIVPTEYRGRAIQEEIIEGVRVVRVWSYASPNKGYLRRILSQFSFGCLAPILGGKVVGKPDIIIVRCPPLFNAIAGRILAFFKRCPYIFTVADLWPESAVQLGVLRNRLFIKLAEWLEWSTYLSSSLVCAVTEGIQSNLLRRGLPPEHIFLLRNGVDTNKFHPIPQAQARAVLNWDDRYTILYAGTHGLTHGLTTILEAAELMRDRNDIRFVLVGDGSEKAGLVAQAQRRNLTNISFLKAQPHTRIPLLLSAADACLVHVRKDVPLFEGMLPIKMYEAMSSARPILLAVNGEARQLAEKDAGAALYVEPENAKDLVNTILYLYTHPELAEVLGQRGRAYAQARFDYDQLTEALDARIAMLLGKESATSLDVAPTPISFSAMPVPERVKLATASDTAEKILS
jgi:colanic acid biosynthesis glycosyl transferase WcaI